MVTAAPASGAGGVASLYSFPRVEGSAALAAAARSQHASLLTRRDVLGGISVAPLTTAGGQVSFGAAPRSVAVGSMWTGSMWTGTQMQGSRLTGMLHTNLRPQAA